MSDSAIPWTAACQAFLPITNSWSLPKLMSTKLVTHTQYHTTNTFKIITKGTGTGNIQDVVVQSLSCVQLFGTPWTAAHQPSLSFTISQSFLKLMSIESVMLSNHFILCHPSFPPVLNLWQHQGLFQWVSSSHQMAEVLELQLQHQSSQWIFHVDFI